MDHALLVWAGMPAPELTDVSKLRLDSLSFFAVVFVASAWLMGEGPERDALLAEARGLRRKVEPAALPILLPALSLGGIGPWRKPLAYWWAARRGRY